MATNLQPIIIPVTLGDLSEAEAQLKSLRKIADDATAPDQTAAAKSYDKLADSVQDVNKAFKEEIGLTKDLTKEFIKNEEGMVEVSAQISKMEDQLFALKLAGKENTEEFALLRDRTVEFKQVVISTDKEIDLLAENTGIAGVAGGLGQIGDRLLALDFEGAGKDAALLNKSMVNMSEIGSKSIKGLAKTVGQLSKAFIKFGISLLANPIFLITVAIIAIVAAVAALLDSLGLLQPILDAIGEVFGFIMDIIWGIVDAFKAFTDAIGLTDFAGKEQAENELARLEEIQNKAQEVTDEKLFALNEEGRIAQINGEDTIAIEKRKQDIILANARIQLKAAEVSLEIGKEKGILDEEEITALEEKIALNSELVKVTESELRVLQAQEAAEIRKEGIEGEKEAIRIAKERAQKAKEFAQNRLMTERRITDLMLKTLEEGAEKEIEISQEKYRRLIEDTNNNEKLLAEEKAEIVELLLLEGIRKETAIREEAKEEEIKEQKAFLDLITEITAQETEDRIAIIESEAAEKIERLREAATEEQQLTEEFREAINDINRQKDQELENQREADRVDEINRRLELQDLTIDERLAFLEELRNIELSEKDLVESEKLLIEQKFKALREEARKKEADKQKALIDSITNAGIDSANRGIGAISSLNDLAFSIKKKGLEEGSAAEEKAARKNFETNKKLQIATAVMSGIQGVIAAFASGSAVPVVGVVLGPLYAAAAGIAAAANIAKISSQTFQGGGAGSVSSSGGGAATAATSSTIDSSTPGLNLFGGANQGNNATGSESVEKEFNINIKADVIAQEMTDEQNKMVAQENGASLNN